jgi:pyruvate-formate lyase-activating enzyme
MEKKVKVRTIIFTEACPLNCRYCDLKNDSLYGEKPAMTKEQVFNLVDTFDK